MSDIASEELIRKNIDTVYRLALSQTGNVSLDWEEMSVKGMTKARRLRISLCRQIINRGIKSKICY